MPEPTSDAWTQIRYDYEHTGRPVEDICAEHGISSGTLRDRVRRWRWNRRRAPIPREGPPAVAAIDTGTAPLARFTSPRWGEVGEPLARLRASSPRCGEPGEGVPAIETPEPPHPNPLPPGEREQTEPGMSASNSGGQAAGPPPADPASIAPRLQSAVARVLPAIETIIARLSAGPLHPREMEQTARALGTLTRTLRELNALLAQHPAPAAADDDPIPEDIDEFRFELARRIRAFIAARQDAREAAPEPEGDP